MKWPNAATRGLILAPPVQRLLGRPLVVLCLVLLVAGYSGGVAVAQDLPDRFERLLVAAMVGSQEGETFEVLREQDRFYLPLTAFVVTCGCEVEERPEGDYIITPIGARLIEADRLMEVDGVRYVSQVFLLEALATQITFDQELYALRFYFPWRPGAPLRAVTADGEVHEVEADDAPAAVTLTSARLNGRYTRQLDRTSSVANGLFHGRVADGRWRLALDQTIGGNTQVREYAWTRIMGQKLVLAGHQRVNLHPLLSGIELTGVQGAWTNQPLDAFAISSQPSELLPRSLRTTTTVAGRGPAAGLAELRIDGIPMRVQTITLDGRYEFLDLQLPSRQSTRIEVYVYERFNRTAPLEIHDHTRGVSDYLLPAGATTLMGGGGVAGNYLGSLIDNRFASDSAAGFVQARHGLSERVTVESSLQMRDGRYQAVAGVTGSMGRNFVGSAAVATSGNAVGWDVDVQGYFARWRVTGRSQQTGAGFTSEFAPGRHNHYGELTYRFTSNLDVGLIAASRDDGFISTQYVLPGLSWQPTARTWLRAHPDSFGRYRFDFSWAAADHTRLSAGYVDRRAIVGVTTSLTQRVGLSANAEWDQRYGDRQAVQATWSADSAWEPGFVAGVRRTGGQLGVTLGAQATFGPGILVSAQFENDPRFEDPLGRRDPRLTVRLFTDLAFAGGQVLGGRSYSLSSTRGAVGGRVRVEGAEGVDPEDLAGLPVLVDGRVLTKTQRGGRFYVGNLRAGVHLVEVDPQGLPIEFSLRETARQVRVEPGAVTAVDITATREYGFAGRVMVEDQIFAFAVVELLDTRGDVVKTARADRFGLYRFDGVAVGVYTIRLSPKNAPGADVVWPTRQLEVDDFSFGNDLVLRRVDIRELSVPEALSGALSGQGGDAQGAGSGQQLEQSQH